MMIEFDLRTIDWTAISALGTLAAVLLSLFIAIKRGKEKVKIVTSTGNPSDRYDVLHSVKVVNQGSTPVYIEDVFVSPPLKEELEFIWDLSKKHLKIIRYPILLIKVAIFKKGLRLSTYEYTRSLEGLNPQLPVALERGQPIEIHLPNRYFEEHQLFKEFHAKGSTVIKIIILSTTGKEFIAKFMIVNARK